jgi:hypothetical protein
MNRVPGLPQRRRWAKATISSAVEVRAADPAPAASRRAAAAPAAGRSDPRARVVKEIKQASKSGLRMMIY